MIELVDSNPESAYSTTDFVKVGGLPVLNMLNISTSNQLADSSWPTLAIRGLQSGYGPLISFG